MLPLPKKDMVYEKQSLVRLHMLLVLPASSNTQEAGAGTSSIIIKHSMWQLGRCKQARKVLHLDSEARAMAVQPLTPTILL